MENVPDPHPGCGSLPAAPGEGSRLVKHTILQDSGRSPSAVALAQHALRQGDSPVVKVELYRRDVIVKRECNLPAKMEGGRPEGAEITEFSNRSMMRLVFLAKNCDCDFSSMITLTYPGEFSSDGRKVKKNLESFRESYLDRYQRRGLWWLEFQERGAPHFHILSEVDLRECGEVVCRRRNGKRADQSYLTCDQEEKWLAQRWFEIVGSGDERHLRVGVAWEVIEKEDGALRYAAAHAGKRKQKTVPKLYRNVGRFWGKIGKISLEKVGDSTVDAAEVFEVYGADALSSRGRVRKYLFDCAHKFSADEEI